MSDIIYIDDTQLIPCVNIKELNGEIQPNSSIACEISIRSEIEPIEINDCICCLIWNDQRQWRMYLKIEGTIVTDLQFEQIQNNELTKGMILEKNLIQTDKPIAINTSLLSPRNQKR